MVLRLYSGNMLVNLNPPNLTLFLLAVSQASALQLLRPLLTRWPPSAGSAGCWPGRDGVP